MREITKVIVGGNEYAKKDIRKMDEVSLRGLLHERVHHNIEIPLYNALSLDAWRLLRHPG